MLEFLSWASNRTMLPFTEMWKSGGKTGLCFWVGRIKRFCGYTKLISLFTESMKCWVHCLKFVFEKQGKWMWEAFFELLIISYVKIHKKLTEHLLMSVTVTMIKIEIEIPTLTDWSNTWLVENRKSEQNNLCNRISM
jgi:hypothetical protein